MSMQPADYDFVRKLVRARVKEVRALAVMLLTLIAAAGATACASAGADPGATCQDWTSAVGPGSENRVRAGHSWPAMSGMHWITAHRLPGCGPGVRTTITPPGEQGNTVGGQGGWGGIYCFAL